MEQSKHIPQIPSMPDCVLIVVEMLVAERTTSAQVSGMKYFTRRCGHEIPDIEGALRELITPEIDFEYRISGRDITEKIISEYQIEKCKIIAETDLIQMGVEIGNDNLHRIAISAACYLLNFARQIPGGTLNRLNSIGDISALINKAVS